jgi:hypothetical protein
VSVRCRRSIAGKVRRLSGDRRNVRIGKGAIAANSVIVSDAVPGRDGVLTSGFPHAVRCMIAQPRV